MLCSSISTATLDAKLLEGQVAGNRPRTAELAEDIGSARRGMDRVDLIIQRAQQGDEAAFNQLFVEYRETVARIVHRVMGPSHEIEDVVQDVFVHVYRSISKFRGDSKFTTWLYRVTANVTKMHLRKRRSRPRLTSAPAAEPKLETTTHDPQDALEREERVQALHRLLGRLSEKKRTVVVLHDFEGISAKEIAAIVEAPVLTVRTRLYYARKELYAALEEEPALARLAEDFLSLLPGKPKPAKQSSSKPSSQKPSSQKPSSQKPSSQKPSSNKPPPSKQSPSSKQSPTVTARDSNPNSFEPLEEASP